MVRSSRWAPAGPAALSSAGRSPSFTLAQICVEFALSLPGPVGEFLSQALFAGFMLSKMTLERAFLIHYGVAVLAVVAVAARLDVGYLG